MYAEFEKDLEEEPKPKFTVNVQSILETILESANHPKMKGKEISLLLTAQKLKGVEQESNPILDKER